MNKKDEKDLLEFLNDKREHDICMMRFKQHLKKNKFLYFFAFSAFLSFLIFIIDNKNIDIVKGILAFLKSIK